MHTVAVQLLQPLHVFLRERLLRENVHLILVRRLVGPRDIGQVEGAAYSGKFQRLWNW
jgi:hypothetical protein